MIVRLDDDILRKYRRIIAVSDIHGNYPLFERVLAAVGFSPRDFLVINGDFTERGARSLETLRRLYDNYRPLENAVVLRGNHEDRLFWIFEGLAKADMSEAQVFCEAAEYNRTHFGSAVSELIAESGIEIGALSDYRALADYAAKEYGEALRWLGSLPLVAQNSELLFVHAGLPDGYRGGRVEIGRNRPFIKNDYYLRDGGNSTGKWVIVGHNPPYNFNDSPSFNPMILDSRKIIGIDGGCGIAEFGQINAFIIERDGSGPRFDFAFADERETLALSRDYSPKERHAPFKVAWPDFELEVLEKGKFFSLCRNVGTGARGYLKNEHIAPRFAGRSQRITVSGFLSGRVGERFYILDDKPEGFVLAKGMDGRMGWIDKAALGSEAGGRKLCVG